MRLLEPGKPVAKDHPSFWKAVGVAVVEDKRASWTPATDERGRPEPEHTAFTRADIEMLRDLGCDRDDVIAYAQEFLNPTQIAKLGGVLHEFGL